MLHRAERHEALADATWDERRARAAIQAIADAACAAFDPQRGWPTHPGDAADEGHDGPQFHLYSGAAGVIWALERLRASGAARIACRFDDAIAALLGRSRAARPPEDPESASYLLRDAGILLLQARLLGDVAAADALHDTIESNLENPAREALWGSPGTLVAAIHMAEATGEERWGALLRRGVEILWSQMEEATHCAHPERPVWIWTQDLYGKRVRYLGAGHGFAGNVFPVLRGARWLDPERVRAIEQRAFDALDLCAVREDDAVNWEPLFDPASLGYPSRLLMQDCHGAPGIVVRLAGARHAGLQELLRAGGEAIWRAGPLTKAPGLCHGTDGNGYAFLKLHALTGEPRWLARARAFAMHACAQSEVQAAAIGRPRFSLWTGDLGLALYLHACVTADAAMPTQDMF